MIELLLLGHPSIHTTAGNGNRVHLGPKLLALLVILALSHGGRGVRRDELAAIFWPDSPEDRARTALRQLLRALRKRCGSTVLARLGHDAIRLRAESVTCDVWQFEHDLVAGEPERALALYRGELLLGFGLRGAPDWEKWLDGKRATLRERACEAHWAVARRLYHERRVRESIHHVRHALALRPFDERGTRQLMSLLAASGDRASALRVYGRFATMLHAELDVPPDPQTLRLREDIVAGALAVGPCFAPIGAIGTSEAWTVSEEAWR